MSESEESGSESASNDDESLEAEEIEDDGEGSEIEASGIFFFEFSQVNSLRARGYLQ